MRRLGVLVGIALAGGVLSASATAAPTVDHVHLRPASTSLDVAWRCDVPDAPDAPAAASGAGAVSVTFTVLPPGC